MNSVSRPMNYKNIYQNKEIHCYGKSAKMRMLSKNSIYRFKGSPKINLNRLYQNNTYVRLEKSKPDLFDCNQHLLSTYAYTINIF